MKSVGIHWFSIINQTWEKGDIEKECFYYSLSSLGCKTASSIKSDLKICGFVSVLAMCWKNVGLLRIIPFNQWSCHHCTINLIYTMSMCPCWLEWAHSCFVASLPLQPSLRFKPPTLHTSAVAFSKYKGRCFFITPVDQLQNHSLGLAVITDGPKDIWIHDECLWLATNNAQQ